MRLGPYEVLAVLGTGGMAEVYRARDTRLGREIALKVISESLTANSELIRRFEQEARLAGSLNHPNLVTVYDVGQHEGAPYLVTELLQGEALRRRLTRGPVALKTALDWAGQLAHGLAAAHARGIVHRDVKPDNVFVTSDGHVKLLDFGIAKLTERSGATGHHGLLDDTETPTGAVTGTGAVLGTPGYMSPEQVRGETVDSRSDLFSLGAVLYEMLSGRKSFPGASMMESAYAIVHHEPEPLPADLPPMLLQVVSRCLEKDVTGRFQSASDLAFDLEALRTVTGGVPVKRSGGPGSPSGASRYIGIGIASLILLMSASAVSIAVRGRGRSVPPDFERVTYRLGRIGAGRFVPDGRIAFSAAFEGNPEDLFIRPAGSSSAQSLGIPQARLAAVSRTGELAVLMNTRHAAFEHRCGTLARLQTVGAAPKEVAEDVEYADWSPAGELAAVIQRPSGRTLEFPIGNVVYRTEGWISDPRFSGRGDRIAFIHHPIAGDTLGQVMVTDLKGGTRTLGRSWPVIAGLVWAHGDTELWFTAGKGDQDTLLATNFEGDTRALYRAPSEIRVDDLMGEGKVLLSTIGRRTDIVFVDTERREPAPLPWTHSSRAVAISMDRKLLVGSMRTEETGEGFQPELVLLRKADGSPPQVLGDGIALDLSTDGRWALLLTRDGRLMAIPTGPGQPRTINTHGLGVASRSAKWVPYEQHVVLAARGPNDPEPRFYFLKDDGSPPKRVSDVPAALPFFVSPAGRGIATRVGNKPVVISIEDGTVMPIHAIEDGRFPTGWPVLEGGSLWLRVPSELQPGRAELVRIDIRTGRSLETRTLAPLDPTGVRVGNVVVAPDERAFVFSYERELGSLFTVRNLEPTAR